MSYLKASEYQDGHAGYSDPVDEQTFLASTINGLEKLPSWKDTAVVVSYDDSDGWYDHQLGPIVTPSQTTLDTLSGPGQCGSNPAKVPTTGTGTRSRLAAGSAPASRCWSSRPYSRTNYVDNTFTSQTSVVRFIEDNWLAGRRLGGGSVDATSGTLTSMLDVTRPSAHRLFLDPSTGQPTAPGRGDGGGTGNGT